MPSVTVREYEHTTHTARGLVPVGEEPALAVQKGALPFTSAAFNARTTLVRITVDVAVAFAIGESPSADNSAADLVAGQTEYFGVRQGAGHTINVVAI